MFLGKNRLFQFTVAAVVGLISGTYMFAEPLREVSEKAKTIKQEKELKEAPWKQKSKTKDFLESEDENN